MRTITSSLVTTGFEAGLLTTKVYTFAPTVGPPSISFFNSSTSPERCGFFAGRGGTVLGTSSTGIWADDVMRHIEVDAILHDSAGQCKVYVDGLLAIDVTGADTKNAGTKTVFDRVVWRSGINATHPRMDDAYIITNDGTAPTGRVGPSRIINLLPNGNGNSSTLTGSDGNSTDNYLLVDENPTNTSDYNGHATEGNKDTYTMGDLTSTNFTVFGARTHLYAAKSDAGSKFMRPVVRSGGTDFTGTSRSLSESYTVYSQSWGVDPNTSAQWTATNINAFEVGAEVRNS